MGGTSRVNSMVSFGVGGLFREFTGRVGHVMGAGISGSEQAPLTGGMGQVHVQVSTG